MAEKKAKEMNIDELTFEQALGKLRQIVEKVEAGEVALEESIQQYELGCKLIQHCRKILDRAERRIEVLSKNLEGTLEAAPAPDLADTATAPPDETDDPS